jgi:hypothetical protein
MKKCLAHSTWKKNTFPKSLRLQFNISLPHVIYIGGLSDYFFRFSQGFTVRIHPFYVPNSSGPGENDVLTQFLRYLSGMPKVVGNATVTMIEVNILKNNMVNSQVRCIMIYIHKSERYQI